MVRMIECLEFNINAGGRYMSKRQWIWPVLCFLLGLYTSTPHAQPGRDVWVLVETGKQRLMVMRGDQPVERFDNIAYGRNGVTREKVSGDNKTPLGIFHVAWVNEKSKYHLFFGLDYPNLSYVKWGWQRGMLDQRTLRAFIRANFQSEIPPQNSPLGGYIGIHGLGRADRRIHGRFNWTKGCIALTNAQIDRLRRWVDVGTTVVIR